MQSKGEQVANFNLIEEISQVNAHGRIFIARTNEDQVDKRELAVVKIPKNA